MLQVPLMPPDFNFFIDARSSPKYTTQLNPINSIAKQYSKLLTDHKFLQTF